MDTANKILQYMRERPALPVTVAVGSLYTAYYLLMVVNRPQLVCRDKRLQKLIERRCPVAREHYWPTWWCFQSHVMTLLRAFVQSWPHIHYRSELLPMPDGGQVKLDWADNDSSPIPSDSAPLFYCYLDLQVPVLKIMCFTWLKKLFSWVTGVLYSTTEVMVELTFCLLCVQTPRTYCAANTDDLEFVVGHINKTFPDAKVIGAGVSLGGVILFNYLAKKGREAGLCAGMCISAAWNLLKSADSLEKPLSLLFYNRYLARNLAKKVESTKDMFKNMLDVDHVVKSTTIREFDERFTSKLFGYRSCEEYYKDASLEGKYTCCKSPCLL